jgi:hypothetical protein
MKHMNTLCGQCTEFLCYSTGFQPLFVQKNTKKCILHLQYYHFIVIKVEFSIMAYIF